MFRCACRDKFPTKAELDSHIASQNPIYHYRINNRGKEYVEPKRKVKTPPPKKVRGEFATMGRQVNEIVKNNLIRLYLDIDEVDVVNIYVESKDDERIFSGAYGTINGAIAAAYAHCLGLNDNEDTYTSKALEDVLLIGKELN